MIAALQPLRRRSGHLVERRDSARMTTWSLVASGIDDPQRVRSCYRIIGQFASNQSSAQLNGLGQPAKSLHGRIVISAVQEAEARAPGTGRIRFPVGFYFPRDSERGWIIRKIHPAVSGGVERL